MKSQSMFSLGASLRLSVILVSMLITRNALAFPDWMGIFPPYERHAGYNPGMYAILMNQDYYGLHAEVVTRVTGYDWLALPMQYNGNVSGNSLWYGNPSGVYPDGAEVTYYFHGWDDWGGNIWDSDSGGNYRFETPAGVIIEPVDAVMIHSLSGGSGEGSYQEVDAVVSHPLGFVAVHNSNGNVSVLRLSLQRTSATVLGNPLICVAGAAAGNLTIAAVDDSVVLAFSDGATVSVYQSQDNGSSYASPTTITMSGQVVELKVVSFGAQDFALAALIGAGSTAGSLYSAVSTDGGQNWTMPVLISSAHYTGRYEQLGAGGNADGIYISCLHPHLNIYYQPVYGIPLAFSANGSTWSSADGAYTNDAIDRVALSVTDEAGIVSWNEAISGQTNTINVKIRRNELGVWNPTTSFISQGFDPTPPQSFNTYGGPHQGVFLFYQDQDIYRVSSDGAGSWRGSVQLTAVLYNESIATIERMIPGSYAAYLVYKAEAGQSQALMWRVLEQTFNIRGDVNNDWSFSAGDAQLAFSIALGSYTPDEGESWRADATKDFMHSAADAQCIFQEALSIPNSCFD